MTSLRERLRALPTFGADLPLFDPDTAPADPDELFRSWLDDAISAGIRFPHAATLATTDDEARPDARVLILKDLTPRGYEFATRTDGAKAHQLEAHPDAALVFFWSELGRQVRVRGEVHRAAPAVSAADDAARAPHARAAARLGVQSMPLTSRTDYIAAFEAEARAVLADPASPTRTWAVHTVVPRTIEFFASTPGAGQIRLRYRRDGESWPRELLWP
ncbi:pyridoxine/pyridoxamine 5'-phosphate oxidase [Microbacterium gorillae]|uniref:pyridoxine/pyridoxamine 5'-phosphate oxidase n=1 Tax=Microbacterium gorillae TaxID=1231063 RepID=UPI00058E0B89|nr:pyridoxamine 5'-phosphate oxidase family protein [Microbacterium gorillae]